MRSSSLDFGRNWTRKRRQLEEGINYSAQGQFWLLVENGVKLEEEDPEIDIDPSTYIMNREIVHSVQSSGPCCDRNLEATRFAVIFLKDSFGFIPEASTASWGSSESQACRNWQLRWRCLIAGQSDNFCTGFSGNSKPYQVSGLTIGSGGYLINSRHVELECTGRKMLGEWLHWQSMLA